MLDNKISIDDQEVLIENIKYDFQTVKNNYNLVNNLLSNNSYCNNSKDIDYIFRINDFINNAIIKNRKSKQYIKQMKEYLLTINMGISIFVSIYDILFSIDYYNIKSEELIIKYMNSK